MDAVFKALADPIRRELLDRLSARNGQNLQQLCEGLAPTRQSVTKHLAVLEAAGLIVTARRGRERIHYLNAAPINDVADRWLSRYDRHRAQALATLKRALESPPVSETSFVYVTYIKTTPEALWRALTDPEFTLQYMGTALLSDWKVGSPVLSLHTSDPSPRDLGQVVLESEPYHRLSYRWHTYQPEHAELFGWSAEKMADLVKEPQSRVTFHLEPNGSSVKLTVVHDGFETDTEMLRALSGRNPLTGGWPEVIANLKTLVETGQSLEPIP